MKSARSINVEAVSIEESARGGVDCSGCKGE